MSTLFVIGFFALAEPRRTSVTRAGGKSTTDYILYTTSIPCQSGDSLPATLRVYTRPSEPSLAPNTVAFVVAKAYIPTAPAVAQLDAVYCCPFNGDPNSDTYEDTIPDFPYPLVLGVGNVPSAPHNLPDNSRAWDTAATQYVRESVRYSTIQCIFDNQSPRWAHTPPPSIRSAIHYIGCCRALSQTGNIAIALDDITFNVGVIPALDGVDASASGGTNSASPSRKRRFNAIASSSHSVSVPSVTDMTLSTQDKVATMGNTTTPTPSPKRQRKPTARMTSGGKPPRAKKTAGPSPPIATTSMEQSDISPIGSGGDVDNMNLISDL